MYLCTLDLAQNLHPDCHLLLLQSSDLIPFWANKLDYQRSLVIAFPVTNPVPSTSVRFHGFIAHAFMTRNSSTGVRYPPIIWFQKYWCVNKMLYSSIRIGGYHKLETYFYNTMRTRKGPGLPGSTAPRELAFDLVQRRQSIELTVSPFPSSYIPQNGLYNS